MRSVTHTLLRSVTHIPDITYITYITEISHITHIFAHIPADLYGYSPEIRLADYHREQKKKAREEEEKKQKEKERDPFKAMAEEERANRQLIKEDGTVRLVNDGKPHIEYIE